MGGEHAAYPLVTSVSGLGWGWWGVGGVRGSGALMLTNKQDKRDGPATEEHQPHPGTPNPCTLPLFFLYISLFTLLSSPLLISPSLPLIFGPFPSSSHPALCTG